MNVGIFLAEFHGNYHSASGGVSKAFLQNKVNVYTKYKVFQAQYIKSLLYIWRIFFANVFMLELLFAKHLSNL